MTGDDVNLDQAAAPPVVAVVVVYAPGSWFDETLDSLARQDYPNLNTLFLLAGGSTDADGADLGQRIRAHLPEAYVRVLEGGPADGPGFGAAANVVLDIVEGDAGLFCLCHDDVALAPDAIRVMLQELYRANAGIVGPKLVDWAIPTLLQDVGLDVDRFGAAAPRVETGEYDQQQHDTPAEVFAVPSACMLLRADLFRALGGFDASMRYHGEDVDLCWRARIGGARVAVAPSARVRHRAELALRRPDTNHAALRARHQMRAAMTLTTGTRLPLRVFELIGVTALELVAGLFTGRFGEAWSGLRALVGALWRFPTYLARRGSIAKLRRGTARVIGARAGDPAPDAWAADETETIEALQVGGSNRLRSYGRVRQMRTLIGVEENIRRWRERSSVPAVTWTVVVVAALVASRTLINSGVPVVGEFLPLPSSPGELWSSFRSGWNPAGLGGSSPNPTGLAAVAVGSVLWFGQMGFGLTAMIVGLVLLGGLGVWRLADLFPGIRERAVALVVYVAMPLVPGIISTGRFGALVAYAAVPWFVHLVRLAAGIGTADPRTEVVDLADGVIDLAPRERARRVAVAGLATAVAVALAPPLLVVVAIVAVVIGVASLLAGAGWRLAAALTGVGLGAVAVAWVLNLPASLSWGWGDLTATQLTGSTGRGFVAVAAMDIGRAQIGHLAIVPHLPLVAAVAIARAWRLTWAARAAGLVIVFVTLAVAAERGAGMRLPETGYLLAPVALGLALAATCAVASFGSDVAGGTFGWRQPLGLLSVAAVAVGVAPSLLTLTSGSWYAPASGVASFVEPHVGSGLELGDFNVLYLGDPRVLPGATTPLGPLDATCVEDPCPGDGIAMTVTGPGLPGFEHRWPAPSGEASDALRGVIADIAGGVTQRGGRLLAPFGVRYIVVPVHDGAVSTPSNPLALPAGLVGAFSSQLDLELRRSPTNYLLFENRSAYPAVALFTGAAAERAGAETPAQLVRADLTSGSAALGSVLADRSGSGSVEPGVLHVAVPYDTHWRLTVDGEEIESRRGFGVMTAFDIPAAGQASLVYAQPTSRTVWLFGVGAFWLAALLAASRLRAPRWLVRVGAITAAGQRRIDLDELAADPDDDGDDGGGLDDSDESDPRLDARFDARPDEAQPTRRERMPVAAPAGAPTSGPPGGPTSGPASGPAGDAAGRVTLFQADDDEAKAAWVDEMFDDEDEDDGDADDVGSVGDDDR